MELYLFKDRVICQVDDRGNKVRLSVAKMVSVIDRLRKSQKLIARLSEIDTDRKAVNLMAKTLRESGYCRPLSHFFFFRFDGCRLVEIESSCTLDDVDLSVWERLPRKLPNGKTAWSNPANV